MPTKNNRIISIVYKDFILCGNYVLIFLLKLINPMNFD